MKRLSRQSIQGISLFVIVFGLIGIITLLIVRAAVNTVNIEAESGTVSGQVSIKSDSSASAGEYAQFGAPQTGSACANTTNTKYFSDIAQYIQQNGDQVIEIPNGTYSGGGTVATNHNSTTGPCKGWLVLKAQTPGQVVVNLSGSGLSISSPASHIAFIGIKFINAGIHVTANNLLFIYTVHDGSPGQSSTDPSLKDFYLNNSNVDNIKLYGADLYDSCDGLALSGSSNVTLTGTVVRDMYDPDGSAAGCHADNIDNHGKLTNFTIQDSWIKGRLQLEDGPFTNLSIVNTWVSNSRGGGMQIFGPQSGGQMSDVRFFANTGQDVVSGDFDGLTRQNVFCEPRPRPGEIGNNTTPGCPIANAPANQSTTNPATIWQQNHPIDNWASFLY